MCVCVCVCVYKYVSVSQIESYRRNDSEGLLTFLILLY